MVQLGKRHVNARAGIHLPRRIHRAGDRMIPEPPDRGEDVIGMHRRLLAAVEDRLLDHLHRIFGQQLQDTHVLPRASGQPLPLFEVGPQLVEAGRQFPLDKHEGMVQGGRPATKDRQVVLGRHDPFPAGVTAFVAGNHARAGHHLDPIHVRLDRHRLEGPPTRNAVAVRIQPHRLVLVHLGGLRHERIEGPCRQGQCRLPILLEQLPNRLGLAGHRMVTLGQGARPQVHIQCGQVLHPGNRGRPVPLQVIHAVLHVGLLVAPCRHAEPWIKAVVARQGRVPRLHLALATFQNRRGHRRGIVPPDLPGHATKELESLNHPRQNRLRLLARQRHGEAIARVTPRQ